MKITSYEAICNIGDNIDSIYENAINGNSSCFEVLKNYIKSGPVRIGTIKTPLEETSKADFNIRCNRLMLKTLNLLSDKITEITSKYPKSRIGIVVATTNSGVEEYERTKNSTNYELGNPAYFLKTQLKTEGFYITVSTACSSGIKAFSTARDLIKKDISDCVIIASVDTLAKLPVYGFKSLGVLSENPSIPFSKNREGMNIGEACAIFIVENDSQKGIDVMGIGESSDIYHPTTPNPNGDDAVETINIALKDAHISPSDIDYINAHGTGTVANDLMESNAIYKMFGNTVPTSSTKPLTGHCLGAAAGIETALCCALLDKFDGRLYPNVYDEEYDSELPNIELAKLNKKYSKCNICMCNSFGFGGSNAIMILGKDNG